MQNSKFNVPFYFSPAFIAIMAALWFLCGIPLVAAIVLLVMRSKRFTTVPIPVAEKFASIESFNDSIKTAQDKLENLNAIYEAKKAEDEKALSENHENMVLSLSSKNRMLKSETETLQKKINALTKELDSAKNDINFFYSTPEDVSKALESMTSAEIKNKIVMIQQKEKLADQKKTAVKLLEPAYVKTSSQQRKLMNQILRGFKSEVNTLIDGLTFSNVDSVRNRMVRAFNSYNSLFKNEGVAISDDYLALKLDELNCWYEYQRKLEDEKELLRAQKEQIREEEKVRREIEREKKKIEKDEKQFNNEISRLMKYMQSTTVEAEKNLYIDKIKELEAKLSALEEDKKTVIHREENAKAGFVYIISNIGSFGENVYKIGMTRRLEPMDRISELSSASVPFPFDVHAMIFAEDAPALETLLHQYFRSHEVNKVNHRKKFFKVSLKEIEDLVKSKFNNTVSFVEIPAAEEYRETMRLNQVPAV